MRVETWQSTNTENQAWVYPTSTIMVVRSGDDLSYLSTRDHPSGWTGWEKRTYATD